MKDYVEQIKDYKVANAAFIKSVDAVRFSTPESLPEAKADMFEAGEVVDFARMTLQEAINDEPSSNQTELNFEEALDSEHEVESVESDSE